MATVWTNRSELRMIFVLSISEQPNQERRLQNDQTLGREHSVDRETNIHYDYNANTFKRTFTSLSRISQLNIAGLAFLYSSMRRSTSGVATLGLLPPITPGLMLPVSWYRLRIFDTHPCDTLSCREMTHGLTPAAAISTILSLMWLGSGRPLMNTPPS